MKVCGFMIQTRSPARLASASSAPNLRAAKDARRVRASPSATRNPTLWRVRA